MVARIVSKVLLVVLALVSASFAQTTYDSIGMAGGGEFYFGHFPNDNPGTAELIIQCFNGLNRAWLITDLTVYGSQATSNMFPVTCTQAPGEPTTLNTTPVTPLLPDGSPGITMTIFDGPNAGQTFTLSLTINSATWEWVHTPTCRSKWGCLVGSAEIVTNYVAH